MTIELFELQGGEDRRFSPYCWRARMALAHKGLEAVYIPVGFTEKDKVAFSGQKLVPVLRDGDTVVSDSWDIACYLEDAYPDAPSLFGGAIGRAEARFFNEWAPQMSAPIMQTILPDIFGRLREEDKAYFRESREARFGRTLEEIAAVRDTHREALDRHLAPLRGVLSAQPYLCGDAPAYADYIVFGHFQTAAVMSPAVLLDPGDVLYGWRERLSEMYGGLGRHHTG